MNIAELQKTVYTIAAEKGWHDEPLRFGEKIYTNRVLAKLALIHSELSEAHIEFKASRYLPWYSTAKPDKPEGYAVEIADVLIRTLDTCEALDLQLAPEIEAYAEHRELPDMGELHVYVSEAVEAARVGKYDEFKHALAGLWLSCFDACRILKLDLAHAIQLKTEYNRSRPHRHGGKLA